MPDEKETAAEAGFWTRLKPSVLVSTASGAVVIISGLLGPVSQYVTKKAEHDLAVSAQEHQQLIDFADKLIASEKIADDRDRTYYRRDVMRFFAAALKPGELKSFAQREAEQLDKRTDRLKDLESKETALSETHAAVAEAEAKLTAAAEAQTAQLSAKGEGAATLGKLADLRKKQADVAVQRASEQIGLSTGAAKDVSKLRTELGLRGGTLTPKDTGGAQLTVATPCKKILADTGVGVADKASAESACKTVDRGAQKWTARLDAYYVNCTCLER